MPKIPVPDRFNDILESKALAHLATIGPDGHPQTNPIWFIRDGDHILFSVKDGTIKLKNIRRNPHVALSISDRENPGQYIELRGEVIEMQLYEDVSFVNVLARKYTGADFGAAAPGEKRYKMIFRPTSWTGQ